MPDRTSVCLPHRDCCRLKVTCSFDQRSKFYLADQIRKVVELHSKPLGRHYDYLRFINSVDESVSLRQFCNVMLDLESVG